MTTEHNSAVTAAEATHRAAVARLAELQSAYATAARAASDAAGDAEAILTKVAAGGGQTGDLAKARAAATKARDAEALAGAVRDRAKAAVDEAEVAVFAATAEALQAEETALRAEARAAAEAADQAVEAARDALANLLAVEDRFSGLRGRLHEAAGRLRDAATTNAALKGQHHSTWPRFKIEGVGFPGARDLSVNVLRRGPRDPEIRDNSLKGTILAAIGMAGPDPSIAANMDLQAKLRAAGTAEIARIAAAQAAGAGEREGLRGPAPIQRGVRVLYQ
jgi:hypothetical protein